MSPVEGAGRVPCPVIILINRSAFQKNSESENKLGLYYRARSNGERRVHRKMAWIPHSAMLCKALL